MEIVIYGNCFVFGTKPPAMAMKPSKWNTKRTSPWEKPNQTNEEGNPIETEIEPKPLQFDPEKIDLHQIKDIKIANDHMLILLENGYLYSVGNGLFGKLGHGETSHLDEPVKIMNNVVSIDVGRDHSAAITTEGGLYMMGHNGNGQLGLSHLEDVYTPTLVSYFKEPVSQVACGESHTLVLLESGSVFAFGRGVEGQLGTLSNIKFQSERTTFSPVASRQMYLLKRPTPRLVNAHEPADKQHIRQFVSFSKIACGQNFSNLVSNGGHLYVCGEGRTGALGQNPCRSHILKPTLVHIQPEDEATGELVRMINVNVQYDPIPVKSVQPRFIDQNESEIEAPPSELVQPKISFDLDIQFRHYDDAEDSVDHETVVDIVSGFGHTLLLTSTGKLFASGLNTHGQCGVGHRQTVKTFTPLILNKSLRQERILKIGVGTHFSAFLTDSGFLYLTGLLPGKTQPFTVPTRVFYFHRANRPIQNFFCGPNSLIVLTDQ